MVANKTLVHGISQPLALARWLLVVAAMVFIMLVVGGITRLTESGLSITEWKPLTGAIPPLNETQWQVEFAKYQQIPEYREVNAVKGMDLAAYKAIYFWEWFHRLWGRVIGLAFALPMVWFAIRKAIPAGYTPRLLLLLTLGGLQGLFGWLMVRSGLTDRTDVSHYWLSVHLITALITLAALVWVALDLLQLHRNANARTARLRRMPALVMAVLFVQLLLGAWVAGLNAGQVASDWPLMQGKFWPAGIDWTAGPIHAFTADPFLLHFLHRWWAFVAVIALLLLARRVRDAGARHIAIAIHIAFGTQILLGIATVMTGVSIWLAVLHQAVGALVVASAAWGAHRLGSRPAHLED